MNNLVTNLQIILMLKIKNANLCKALMFNYHILIYYLFLYYIIQFIKLDLHTILH